MNTINPAHHFQILTAEIVFVPISYFERARLLRQRPMCGPDIPPGWYRVNVRGAPSKAAPDGAISRVGPKFRTEQAARDWVAMMQEATIHNCARDLRGIRRSASPTPGMLDAARVYEAVLQVTTA